MRNEAAGLPQQYDQDISDMQNKVSDLDDRVKALERPRNMEGKQLRRSTRWARESEGAGIHLVSCSQLPHLEAL